jgi:hypothetical protein
MKQSSKKRSFIEEEEDVLQENVRDYIYAIPIGRDNATKGNNLVAKGYSTSSDAHNTMRFRRITKAKTDQLELENLEAEVSKSLLGKFNPNVQRNSNIVSDNDECFGDDILYAMMKENVPKGYIFSPKRETTFTASDFSIPMKDNKNPGKVTKDLL